MRSYTISSVVYQGSIVNVVKLHNICFPALKLECKIDGNTNVTQLPFVTGFCIEEISFS